MMGDTLHVTWGDGTTADIPEIWLVGFTTSTPNATIADALAWWKYQLDLEARDPR